MVGAGSADRPWLRPRWPLLLGAEPEPAVAGALVLPFPLAFVLGVFFFADAPAGFFSPIDAARGSCTGATDPAASVASTLSYSGAWITVPTLPFKGAVALAVALSYNGALPVGPTSPATETDGTVRGAWGPVLLRGRLSTLLDDGRAFMLTVFARSVRFGVGGRRSVAILPLRCGGGVGSLRCFFGGLRR